MRIGLLPMGPVPAPLLAQLARELAAYGLAAEILPDAEVPPGAFDLRRGQHRAEALLPRQATPTLAVTTVDLYTEGLNFVFGLANAGSGGAVVSLFRLSTADHDLLLARLVKEGAHELGHTWGLGHCEDAACVMHFSDSLAEADAKGRRFCATCRRSLPESVRTP